MNGSPMYTLQEELSQSHKNTSLANKQHINLQIPIRRLQTSLKTSLLSHSWRVLGFPPVTTTARSLIPIKGLAAAKRGCLIMPIHVLVPNTNLVMILSKKNGIGWLVH